MSDPGNARHLSGDPLAPLRNLAAVRDRMDSFHQLLVDSVNRNTLLPQHHMDRVTSELTTAIHQCIVNGAALLSFSQSMNPQPDPAQTSLPDPGPSSTLKHEAEDSDKEDDRMEGEREEEDMEIVELDAVELLAEHIHLCEICGKGFKRDANLRMHMRAHGNQFKTPKALAKPPDTTIVSGGDLAMTGRKTRFSCPYIGCNRNKQHRSFRPLKSVVCVKNHFKRSHCPKMYSCNRCHKKSFSVMADLKNHLKHCGDHARWRCSCGTTFSRKDKLFGHMALFEGHMPAVGVGSADDDDDKSRVTTAMAVAAMEEDVPGTAIAGCSNSNGNSNSDCNNNLGNGMLFDGLLEGFGSIENQSLEEAMTRGSSIAADWDTSMVDEYFSF